jgi:hypothetical protein
MSPIASSTTRSYDFVGFGDEVPGILALVCAAREYRARVGSYPRSLLIFKQSSLEGIGGHLVRGKLAYLDRCQAGQAGQLAGVGLFGDPPAIYKEFLRRSGVNEKTGIALDPLRANVTLDQMRREAGIDILSAVEIQSVLVQDQKINGIELTNGETYLGRQFIDATVNAELAQAAGVKKLNGFEVLGLPESELCVTLAFETVGLSWRSLKAIESQYLNRFTNLADTTAQNWLKIAAGSDPALLQQLRADLVDEQGRLKTMSVGADYIDVRSSVLSIAYHSFRGKKLSLQESGVILDKANIAILASDRLVWNALLFYVDAAQVETLSYAGAKPTPGMQAEMAYLERWLKSLGATAVKPATELYIRHSGNIKGAVDPLSGARMLKGGVPASEALGTFSYWFDVRGGIKGFGERAAAQGITNTQFKRPLFNVGIHHAIVQDVANLAILGPASGFAGYGCTAGRIVEFNVAVGQGIGIACCLALLSGKNLAAISNTEVRAVLTRMGQLPKIYGTSDSIEANRMADFEQKMSYVDVEAFPPVG